MYWGICLDCHQVTQPIQPSNSNSTNIWNFWNTKHFDWKQFLKFMGALLSRIFHKHEIDIETCEGWDQRMQEYQDVIWCYIDLCIEER